MNIKNTSYHYSNNCIKDNLLLFIKNFKYLHYFYINEKNSNILFTNQRKLYNLKNDTFSKESISGKYFIKKNINNIDNYIAIIKTTGRFNINPKLKKIFQLLKIRSPNNVIIIKKNKKIISLLKKINVHIVWGEITNPVLFKLIMKKNNINIKISEKINKILSQTLFNEKNNIWQKGNKELEDIISYIMTDRFLLNFKLNSPSVHFKRKNDGKSVNTCVGYVGKLINNILVKMF